MSSSSPQTPPPPGAGRDDSTDPMLESRGSQAVPPARDPVEELASQYMDELRAGRQPSVDQYVNGHPEFAQQIRDLFPFITALEDWKTDREMREIETGPPRCAPLDQLGKYRIVREIGRGGMGVVYEAEEAPLGRRVALKVLPRRFARTSRWRAHFVREAQIVAQLKHPNIVPVFTYGEERGQSFFVMQLIQGVGLDRLIDRLSQGAGVVAVSEIFQQFQGESSSPDSSESESSPLRSIRRNSWSQLARIGLQAAAALHYAHAQGTFHRDIKPANVMIDVKGHVWIADFGLALTEEQAAAAGRVPLAGTLRYMAPEQFSGRIDARCDVYSLGATLYQLCTLKPAFPGDDRETIFRAIRAKRPIPPRRLVPQIPVPLERIILRAMQRDPRQRYQSAEEMRQDLWKMLNPSRKPFRKALWDWAWDRLSRARRQDNKD